MPDLPLELIQLILVECVRMSVDGEPAFAASLQLVSHSTYTALLPHLFSTLIVTAPHIYAGRTIFSPSCQLFQRLARRPNAPQRSFVRHLVFKEPKFNRHSWSTQISSGFNVNDPRFWQIDILEAYSDHVLRLVAGAVSPRAMVFTNLERAATKLTIPVTMLGTRSSLCCIMFGGVLASHLVEGRAAAVILLVGQQVAAGLGDRRCTLLLTIDWDLRTSDAVNSAYSMIQDLMEMKGGLRTVVDLDHRSGGRRRASEDLLALLRGKKYVTRVMSNDAPPDGGGEPRLVVRWLDPLPNESTARTPQLCHDLLVSIRDSIL